MDPITLIITALAAGAVSGAIDGLKDTAKDTAKAAYAKLRGLARNRVAARPNGGLALNEFETAPDTWGPVLKAELTASKAADDAELLDAAKALMELVDQAGARQGKYHVTISGSKGVQIGDGNIQVNRF